MNPLRKLDYRFNSLAYHIRLEIADKLNLIKDEDEGISDIERFKRIFKRVGERDLFVRLWDEVEQKHTVKSEIDNPFN